MVILLDWVQIKKVYNLYTTIRQGNKMPAKRKLNAHPRSYRMPQDILDWLRRRMADSQRSENGEVIYLLTELKKRDKDYAS
jgi:hypothetical protein